MHMAVNACTFVPPALHFFGGNFQPDFHLIFPGGKRGDVINFSGVAGVVFPRFLPVNIKNTFAENPVKFQIDLLIVINLRNIKHFAVFAGTMGEVRIVPEFQMAFRIDPVHVIGFCKIALNRPIVGDIQMPPWRMMTACQTEFPVAVNFLFQGIILRS